MHLRTRFVLPVVQIAVAVGLTTSNRLRPVSTENPTWTAPDKQFCNGLNAPATLIRVFLTGLTDKWLFGYYPIEFILETIIYFVLVGLLWYIVSIETAGKGRSVLATKIGCRRSVDILAIIFGIVLAVVGIFVRGQFGIVSAYSNLVAIPYYVWGIAVVVFYGHDLWASSSAAQEQSVGKDHSR